MCCGSERFLFGSRSEQKSFGSEGIRIRNTALTYIIFFFTSKKNQICHVSESLLHFFLINHLQHMNSQALNF